MEGKRHNGPKISKAAATLASDKASKKSKSEAAKVMNNHKQKYH